MTYSTIARTLRIAARIWATTWPRASRPCRSPLIYALKHGDDSQRAAIRRAIKDGGLAELEPVVAAIDATGGLEYTQRAAETESALALAALDVLPASSYKEGLTSLARFAVEHTT
jgi:octaprenyl-diphosphate synthase